MRRYRRQGKRKRKISDHTQYAVYRRDDFRCSECGILDATTRRLECHHIVSEQDGGKETVDNLKTVCRRCHIELHKAERAARDKVYAGRLEFDQYMDAIRKSTQ